MLGNLFSAVIKTAFIPLAIIDDVVSMGDGEGSSTGAVVESVVKDILD